MFSSKLFRLFLLFGVFVAGVWFISQSATPAPEGLARHQAQMALAPGRANGTINEGDILVDNDAHIVRAAAVSPAEVDVRTLPSRPSETDYLLEQYLNGSADLELNEGPVSESVFQTLLNESARQKVDNSVQNYQPSNSLMALNAGANFKSIDYTQSQQGVPPDPDITVGKDHIIVGVNTSFQVFDKNGTSLVGPTLFSDFWGSNCGNGSGVTMFDPYLDYDEKEGRYILGITAYDPNLNGGDNGWACIAVSKTDSAADQWWLYSFDGNPGGGTDYFFDYPHLGVGQDALYLGANMFGASFVRNHIFAYDKFAMYSGASANSVKINVGSGNFTLQPAKIHGFANGGWPTNANEPHYFVDAQYGNNQNTLTVWQFNDPFGSASLTQAGTVNVNNYSLPVSQPQLGGSNIQGNDNRLLDVKYWGGKLYTTHTVGCNPGGGTVNCIRWYEIDISSGSPSLVDQGTFSSSGEYRSFPAIAPNACGDLMIGYTKTSSSMYPSVYVAGRESGDASGQLKNETLLKAGEDFYTAYDSVPRRWGDYTGMGIDPDGVTFWYVGEYSRPQATARWSTWVGSYSWSGCNVGGPTPTPGPTATATNTPPPTSTPPPTACTTYSSSDTPISLPNGTSSIASNISVAGSGTVFDVNVSVDMDHIWVGDIIFDVSHNGTTVRVIDQPGVPASTYGCSGDDIVATLDDDAAVAIENQCAGGVPTINGTFSPNNALSAFNSGNGNGTWTLTVIDTYTAADDGALNGWSVEICTEDTGGPTPTNTPVPPTPTNTPAPPTPTPPPSGSDVLYVSSTSGGNAGGVAFADEDILEYDTGSGTWAMYFDGSDTGVTNDVNGFALLSDGTILLTFNTDTSVPGVGTVDDSDIVQFTPTSLGSSTAGTYSWFFDGSDVGLTTNGEDVDSITVSNDGKIVISTIGSHSVSGVSGNDEDLLIFTATTFGSATSGTWARYFDGSDVGLSTSSSEDVYGAYIANNDDIYLNTSGNFSVAGASGSSTDIFVCTPSSIGNNTACSFSLYWDGSANGYGSENMDGFAIVE